ncbi:hypothetical protein AAF712_002773 [Marasmius tenuissimus]|uniref:Uncharacterized protein n=1 Tax=Marasmius tenuissimus TaxID=585030 RepID=A0ABR3A8G4_9AGAR
MALSQESSTSSLALSDIIHTSTLSPGPPTALKPRASEATRSVQSSSERSGSPEPLQEEELNSYRNRIREMGLLSGASDMVSPREKELSEMVLRLIEAPRADSTQLERQATLISQLTAQRDFLTQIIADERARMESERDGWERAAEALIAQHQRSGKNVYPSRQDELERQCLLYVQDNAELRSREHETRARLSALEGELYRLKPMLIMHPQPSYNALAPNSSFLGALPYPSATGAVALKESRDKTAKKRKRNKEAKAARAEEASDGNTTLGISASDGPGTDSASQLPAPGPSSVAPTSTIPQSGSSLFQDTQRSSAPSIYQHLLRKPSNQPDGSTSTSNAQKSKRSKSPKRYTTITSDARSEHFLLAARRLGRERANVVSGLINAKTERDQEKHKQAKEEMERERQAAALEGKEKEKHYLHLPLLGRDRSHMSIPDPTTPTPGARGSPSTPKRASTGSLPSVQLFQHPGNAHAYMFVPNTGIIGYPHLQTPPGAVRMPTVVNPMNQPSVTSTGSAHKPSVPPSPSPASTSAPPPPAGTTQTSSPQVRESVPPRRQNRKNLEHDSSSNSLAAAINQSMDTNGSSGPSQAKTPLASLLSAAQSMMEQGGGAGSSKDKDQPNGKGGKRKASGTTSQPESPNSKRRRVNPSSGAAASGSARNSGKRVRSALDVLADQAAAHNQDDQAGTGKGRAKAKAKSAEADASADTEDASATKEGSPPARRSSRSNRGKRKEALANAAAPRMISPAISQRESTPRMIAPPDRQRNTVSSITGLLPPPIITPMGPSAPAPPVLTKDDPADPLDVDQVGDIVTPHVANDGGSLNGNEQEELSPSGTVNGHREDVSMVSPGAPQSPILTTDHAKEPDAPSQTTENTTRRPLPKEPPIHTILEPTSKDKRPSDVDGDIDADGDADPDVEMETKDPVVVIPGAASSNKT